jgi:hypothetical protein
MRRSPRSVRPWRLLQYPLLVAGASFPLVDDVGVLFGEPCRRQLREPACRARLDVPVELFGLARWQKWVMFDDASVARGIWRLARGSVRVMCPCGVCRQRS